MSIQIIVQGHLVETKEIWDIEEAPHGYHGFYIKLIGNTLIAVTEKENYDASMEVKRGKNDRYRKLREAVKDQWQKDKTDILTFKL